MRLIAKICCEAVVIGYLFMFSRMVSEQLTADRVPDTAPARPGRENEIKPPIRQQADGRERIPVGPGIARRTVACHFPAVVEHEVGSCLGCTAGEHPDLIGIRACVEVTADDNQIAAGNHLANEADQLSDLVLPGGTGIGADSQA